MLVQYINPNDLKNFQLIYSSQLYGTFFGVYALFVHYEEQDEPLEGLKEIHFKVVNYKGLLDIGIEKIIGPLEFTNDAPVNVKIFNIEMRAMNGVEEYVFPWDQSSTLNPNDYIFVQRTLHRLHGDGQQRIGVKNGVFDEEFYYREGIHENTYPGRTPLPLTEMPEINGESLNFSGRLCPTSVNIVTGG